ncbi:glycosyltransferase involved in cell wall biosynthesis [Blastococcus colisei]|uniref:Glycosyltransferase involved in cell wall biosynthesis n=1 Tax=Blastococcus colisei TaxID=1564162 RepID=A0A543P1D1_9ACTN|nr:glycosyltransferase family 4 protein [Blastococcus colisei]TQN37902.1 glycosyltransferase involved in cell wall biosynthesis [Blastococcus colisei]
MSKVLLVGKGAPDRGGIPTFLETLLHSRLAEEHELRFLNVAHAGMPQGGRATPANVRRTVRDVVAVWRAARGHDVVHIHSALSPAVTVVRASLLALAGRSRGCAVVVHAHGGNIRFWLTSPWRRTILRVAMLPVHRVVAVWTAGLELLQTVLPPERVALIDNGVPIEGSAASGSEPEHEPPRILYVGLLTPRKGVLDLLTASRLLIERGVAHELCLLGGTPDEGPAAEAEVRAALNDSVQLLGTRPREEMPAAFAAAEVLCLPSWWEAMPLSVLEAMAAGLPVVATDVGDVARAVVDGVTGYVVPSHDPESLAAALEPLLTDPDLRRRMGAAGRVQVTEMFSADVTAGAVSALYAELRGGPR